MAVNPRIEELRKRLEKEPGSRLFAQLAEELRKDGDLADAIRVARSGLQQNPSYPSARMTLGRALLDTGDLAAARGEFEAVLRAAPDNILASRFLGECLEGLGDLGAALLQYRATLRLAPGDRQVDTQIRTLEQRLTAGSAVGAGPRPLAAASGTATAKSPTARPSPPASPPPVASAPSAPRPVPTSPPAAPSAPPSAVAHAPSVPRASPPDLGGDTLRPAAPKPYSPPAPLAAPAPAASPVLEESFDLEAPFDGAAAGWRPSEQPRARPLEATLLVDEDEGPAFPGDTAEPPTERPPERRAPAVSSVARPSLIPEDLERTEPSFVPGDLPASVSGPPLAAPPVLPTPPAAAQAAPERPAAEPEPPRSDRPFLATWETGAKNPPPAAPPIAESRPVHPPRQELAAPSPIRPDTQEFPFTAEASPFAAPGPEPFPAAPVAPEAALSSSTLAELYFDQGFPDKAIEVYEELLGREPENERARARLRELLTLRADLGGSAAASSEDDRSATRRRKIERTIVRLERFLDVVKRG